MERLTARDPVGNAYLPYCEECGGDMCRYRCEHFDKVCEKLAGYEEQGEQEEKLLAESEAARAELGRRLAAAQKMNAEMTDAQAVMVKEFEAKLEELHEAKSELNAAVRGQETLQKELEKIKEIKELCTDEVAELARILHKAMEAGEVDHIRDLLQAEQDGRLVVLPSKTVWELTMDVGPDCDLKCPVDAYDEALGCDLCSKAKQFAYERPCTQDLLKELGKTVFLTREEAEAALAQEGESDGN